MSRVRITLLGLVFSLFIGLTVAQAADKFAYVDLSRTFSEYSKTKDYDKTLSDKEKVYTTDRDKKINELKAFQDKINLLNDKEKEAKKSELQSKLKTLQDYDRQKQADLRKDQEERMKEILKDIEEAVKQYSQKQGYTFVFNDRVLVYQDKTLDITTEIVAILNKKSK
ncbi:MAG: OmpH family outer membrane protein [Candidatus Omnitrophica bacterium]|jgi:Skp family chaperone for outer membrane proteins|nr:OmpH family outer membrane protein [Candidatus Omnitrophota bacterium]